MYLLKTLTLAMSKANKHTVRTKKHTIASSRNTVEPESYLSQGAPSFFSSNHKAKQRNLNKVNDYKYKNYFFKTRL